MSIEKVQLLEDRIERLERAIGQLQATLDKLQADGPDAADGSLTPARPEPAHHEVHHDPMRVLPVVPKSADLPAAVRAQSTDRPTYSWKSEGWPTKIAFAVFFALTAVSFFMLYGQSWFTPGLQIVYVFLVATFFGGSGLTFYRTRYRFGRLLITISLLLYYTAAFTALRINNLFPYEFAFGWMSSMVALSMFHAVRRNDQSMGVVSLLVGLAMPFMTTEIAHSLPGYIVVACLVLCAAAGAYWIRGWRFLLFVTSVGGWIVLLIGYVNMISQDTLATQQWALQFGVLFMLYVSWFIPVRRGILRAENPERWPAPPPVRSVGYFFNHPALPLAVATPILGFVFSRLIWDFSEALWGWIILESSAIFVVLYLVIRERRLFHLAQMQGLTAAVLLAVGLFHLLDSYALLFAFAVEAALLRLAARTFSDRLLSFMSHLFFMIVFLWLMERLIDEPVIGIPVFNLPAFSELATLALGIASAALIQRWWVPRLYQVLSFFLLLAWLLRQVKPFPDGQSFVSIAWIALASLLLYLSIRRNDVVFRTLAVVTYLFVIVKVLLVDLSGVQIVWRILLFIAIGGVSFLLGHFVPDLFSFTDQHEPLHAESDP